MTDAANPAETWFRENYDATVLALEEVHARLRSLRSDDPDGREAIGRAARAYEAFRAAMASPPAIDLLATRFGLDPFAQAVVLLCLGFELDGRFAALAESATVGLALEALADPNWAGLDPTAPLRYWEIVDVDPTAPLVEARLRLDEEVVGFLLGRPIRTAVSVFDLPPLPGTVLPAQVATARELAGAVLAAGADGAVPAVELHGAGPDERRLAAALCADVLGLRLEAADVRDLPQPGPELERFLRRVTRNAHLMGRALLLESDDLEPEPADRSRIRRALAIVTVPLFVSGPAGLAGEEPTRPLLREPVEWLDADARLEVWRSAATPLAEELPPGSHPLLEHGLEELAETYRLGARAIEEIAAEALTSAAPEHAGSDEPASAALAALRAHVRRHVRSGLEPLAERVPLEPLETLVLPEREAVELAELETHVRHEHRVNRQWGLGGRRGGHVSALFAGPSGTGKTLAARALAHAVGLDLFRIDLSAVMSKYIGETEKNLRRIFDAAEAGGAILLFDEADALFGKRSEVRDSHDRYANVEVAYLLQKLEETPAPTILTTNMKDALDPAFVRRLRFIVDFPFPDEEARRRIWSGVFPPDVPLDGFRPERLARLIANGGTIRNVAFRATFLAARDDGPVGMRHLLEAARSELRKAGRTLSAAETAGWVDGAG